MASQQTMSTQDDHLSEQTYSLLVILTRHINKRPEKKTQSQQCVSRGQASIFTRLGCSCYYRVFFNIMTCQMERRDWDQISLALVNMTASSPSILYFEPWDSISWVKWHSENSLLKSMHSVHLHFQFLYPNIGWQIWKSQTKIMLELLGETGHRWQSFCAEI